MKMCVTDITEDLGQFIAPKVVCCFIGAKRYNLCLQTQPIISGIVQKSYSRMCVYIVRQGKQYEEHTDLFLDVYLMKFLMLGTYDLLCY